ncbi:SDR family NAD(P)-dependent oxidoreductase [Patescibacteria group bacterium]|nr:SDR family NAD(P)-dependent oxidoreductase [Patescibacteria group bacterium]
MKKVLITGTGRGIGYAAADKFLAQGYYVVGTSTSGEAPINHPNFECHQLQLLSEISINSCADQIFIKHPQFDLFISNAGFAEDDSIGLDVSILRKSLEINVVGTVAFAQKAVEYVMDGSGRVIFLGSTMGSITDLAGTDFPSYRISKAALHMYSRIMSLNLEDRKISVVTFHPGWVKTDMGGPDAPKPADKAADDLFELATRADLVTGTFWNETQQADW